VAAGFSAVAVALVQILKITPYSDFYIVNVLGL